MLERRKLRESIESGSSLSSSATKEEQSVDGWIHHDIQGLADYIQARAEREFDRGSAEFEALDTNRDGVIDRQEWEQAFPRPQQYSAVAADSSLERGISGGSSLRLLAVEAVDAMRGEDLHVRIVRAVVQAVSSSSAELPLLLEAMASYQLREAHDVLAEEAEGWPGSLPRGELLHRCRSTLGACLTEREAAARAVSKEWLAGGSRMPDLVLGSLSVGRVVDLVTGVSQEYQSALDAWRQGRAAASRGLLCSGSSANPQLGRLELFVTEASRAHKRLLHHLAAMAWEAPPPVASVFGGP
jgi:hypothetical protein